jgi:membrane associated rhomboid family serine protease
MTKWVTTLIAANVAMFLLQITVPGLTELLWLTPALVAARPWTLVTYMFLHGSWWHIFFNMLSLYMFGPRLEVLLGGRRFITLYLLSGLGGALLAFMPSLYHSNVLGASGAVLGVITAYALLWPRDRFYIYGIIPIEALWGVVLFSLYSLIGATGAVGAGTAHFSHLGGMAVGWGYMSWLRTRSGAQKFKERAVAAPNVPDSDAMQRWNAIPLTQLHEINRAEVARLLDKVRTQGIRSLSLEERATLDRFSRA